ncbi:MAG: copper chaperone PCu(A)C [Croceibacterium sp.]
MTRVAWMAMALGLATAGLAGCGDAPAVVDSGPKAPDGVTVTNAKLMLPAVKGNPGAVYFDIANSSQKNMMIRAASVDGAGSTMMHTGDMQEVAQVDLAPGSTVKFEPGGQHVMASNLADTVVAGGKADVTVTFVGGTKVVFPADVHAAGDPR